MTTDQTERDQLAEERFNTLSNKLGLIEMQINELADLLRASSRSSKGPVDTILLNRVQSGDW